MILNSDDIFYSNKILEELVNKYLKKRKHEIYLEMLYILNNMLMKKLSVFMQLKILICGK